jgi:hypothetical protein
MAPARVLLFRPSRVKPMKRLVLTNQSAYGFTESGFADLAIPFDFRFVWGPLPPPDKLAAYVAASPDGRKKNGSHWSDMVGSWPQGRPGEDLALLAFCKRFEHVELWFNSNANDQLQLVWLLDHFRSDPEAAAKLRLRIIGSFDWRPDVSARAFDKVPAVHITTRPALETAAMVWQAYCAPTPQACFDFLHRDLSALPLLKPALADLLREIPSEITGLGATEMRLLELVAWGFELTNALFYLPGIAPRRIFNDWEIGLLLGHLAHAPTPAIAGLDDELRTLGEENYGRRLEAYQRSRLSVTEFGNALLAHKADLSRHNPIDRWWGGTRLTNENLWRRNTTLAQSRSAPPESA